jgi:hypothetical protein
MQCPHCKNQLKVPVRAYNNANSYSKACNVTTECCFNTVKIIPHRSFEVVPLEEKEDDWGVPVGEEGRKVYQKLDESIKEESNKIAIRFAARRFLGLD